MTIIHFDFQMLTRTGEPYIPLSERNKHPRDEYIQFFEVGHRYDLTDPSTGEMFHPTSTTTLIHKYFNDFDLYFSKRKPRKVHSGV